MSKTMRRLLLGCFVLFLALGAVSARLAQRDDSARDAWQRPQEVLDLLGVSAGSVVADVGCGRGYFVLHLSRRVGNSGIVYAVDVDDDSLEELRKTVKREKIENVRVVRGKPDDPLLPDGALDAVLIVNAYHEMRDHDAMLRGIFKSLRSGGRVAIIDAPGNNSETRDEHSRRHTISEAMVREDAERNGFRFRSRERAFDHPERNRGQWFFLIFEK